MRQVKRFQEMIVSQPGLFWGGLILLLILLAYGNSFRGAFVFDDLGEVLGSAPVRSASGVVQWPVAHPTRTLGDLTFLINRRWGGDALAGYHGVNLVIHVLAALVLLGILRRVLRRLRPFDLAPERVGFLAGIIAVLWAVHPIQTQAVTYLVQRHEILVSLFYLGTLYAYIRVREGDRPGFWRVVCLVVALLGMFTKEIMVTAPLALLAYEGLILRTSWRAFRQQAAGFWVLLALMPLVVVALVLLTLKIMPLPDGVFSVTATPWTYALTQAGVLAHYLKLIVWPRPLCIDYGWPIARGVADVAPAFIALWLALGLAGYGVFRRRAWAFLPVVFGLILLPTSSLLPVPDAAMEHRFYLPSALVITGLVCGGWGLWCRWGNRTAGWLRVMGGVLFLVLVGGGILLTRERNQDYADPVRLWRGAIEVNPENPRAWFHLARAYRDGGQFEKARLVAAGLLAMVPDYTSVDLEELVGRAKRDAEERRRIRYYGLAHTFLGVLDLEQNRTDSALLHLQNAVRVYPDPDALYNLALAHYRLGAWGEARLACEKYLSLEPNDSAGWRLLGLTARAQGDEPAEVAAFQKVRVLIPTDREARFAVAWLWAVAADPGLRQPAESLRIARDLMVESEGKSPKVRELLKVAEAAVAATTLENSGK